MTRRILIVEDDPTIREVISDALADEGYELCTAKDGADALDLILIVGEKQPHLILLDLQMPSLDGEQFMQQYQAMPGPCVPIILMSGLPDLAARAAKLGAAGYLPKPFDVDKLIELVGRQLRPNRSRNWVSALLGL